MTDNNQEEIIEKDIVTKSVEKVALAWKQIIFLAVVLIFGVAIYAIVKNQQHTAEKIAWKTTAQAMLSKDVQKELEKTIREFPNTEAATYATLQLIKINFDANEITKARVIAKDFLSKKPTNYFAPQIRVEYARLLEWEGKWEMAKDEYTKISNGYLLPESMMGKARCLEQLNKLEQAKVEYKKIISKRKQEGWWQTTKNIKKTASFRLAAIDSIQSNSPEVTISQDSKEKKPDASSKK